MTTLKTVEEIGADFQDKYRASVIDSYISEQTKWLMTTLTQDRQAIADVLCAKLEGVQTYGHEYLISKEEVKKIIKQTLSNK